MGGVRTSRTANRAQRAAVFVALVAIVGGATGVLGTVPNVRLSNDVAGGYITNYEMVTGNEVVDATIDECSQSRGRQNEPSVAINPRDNRVIVGSSNDYCGVYNAGSTAVAPDAVGPIWLGYYRSEDGGSSFQSSLVPGYPGDATPYASRAKVRTGSAGDPVLAWDTHGRLFIGAESSDSNTGIPMVNYGDVWVATFENPAVSEVATINDGKEFKRSVVVDKGAAAPGNQGNFPDKTSLEVDRTGGDCDGNVYFAWSRFNGSGVNGIYFSRSTNHGATWSTPVKLTETVKGVQFPDISVTGNGNVYVTYRQFETKNGQQTDAINIAGSTNCGATFGRSRTVTTFTAMDLGDLRPSGATARDCGGGANACQSPYTFFRADTGPRSTADQGDGSNQYIYIVYEAIVPGSEIPTGNSFGWAGSGMGGRSAIYYVRYNAATGSGAPQTVDTSANGQQLFPDVTVSAGMVHMMWWDSRYDPNNDGDTMKIRPIGNDEHGNVAPALDVVYGHRSASVTSGSWSPTRITNETSSLQWEQFSGRTVPFAGDYNWIDAQGGTVYMVWTDGRDVVDGTDPRYPDGHDGTDVLQCRAKLTSNPDTYGGDTCPRAGGLDQNIYGSGIILD